jgi:hypothetical protein
MSRIVEAGLKVFTGEVRIILEYLLFGNAGAQQFQNKLHGDSRSSDDRLATQYFRINR